MKWVVKHQYLYMLVSDLRNENISYQFESVNRVSETQLQVGENSNLLTYWLKG